MRIGRRTVPAVFVVAAIVVLASCSPAGEVTDPVSSSSAAQVPTRTVPTQLTPVVASVTAPPIPVPATDGRIHMAYELVLINPLASQVLVKSISAVAGDTTFQSISGDEIVVWMRVLGTPERTAVIGPGQAAIVLIDAVVDSEGDIPGSISHTIDVDVVTPSPPLIPATVTEREVAPTTVDRQEVVRIGPPLDGTHWLDGDSCCAPGAHRSALNPLNGQFFAPERFAIDYVRLRDDGRLFDGDRADLRSYAYFGTEVYAVADGPIVSVVTDLPDQVPGVAPQGLELTEYGGNHVVQDIGGGRYAFYAHLRSGDGVKMKEGDHLEAGDVVGLLGNSGNSDAPHLHFHIMDGTDPLAANGLPFEIESFDLESRVADTADLDGLLEGTPPRYATGVDAGPRTDSSPLSLDVMTYDVENQ